MLGRLIPTNIVLVVLHFGCDVGPAPIDAGPPPCLEWSDGVASNVEACGLCLHPHERTLGAFNADEIHAVAVPEGLIVVAASGPGHVFFVGLDGAVTHQVLAPSTPEQTAVLQARPLLVPGTNRFWIAAQRAIRFGEQDRIRGDEADAILMAYGASGSFDTIARGTAPRILPAVAMAGGELAGRVIDGLDLNERWVLFRPLPDGTVEQLEHPDAALRGGTLDSLVPGWPMPERGAVIVLDHVRYHFGPDFEQLSLPAGLRDVVRASTRRDGSAMVLSIETPSLSTGYQLGVQELGADGSLRWAQPLSLNPAGITPGADIGLVNLWETPGGRTLAAWAVYPEGGWVSGIDRDGNLVWPEPRVLFRFDDATPQVRWNLGAEAVDGRGNAYTSHSDLLDPQPGPPALEFYARLGIDRLDENADYVWPDQVIVETCGVEDGRLDPRSGLWDIVGAHDEGVWLVYSDILVGSNGREAPVVKVALLLPDGTFAW